MSTEDRDDKDPLQSLIVEILEAENSGITVDRDALFHSLFNFTYKRGRLQWDGEGRYCSVMLAIDLTLIVK